MSASHPKSATKHRPKTNGCRVCDPARRRPRLPPSHEVPRRPAPPLRRQLRPCRYGFLQGRLAPVPLRGADGDQFGQWAGAGQGFGDERPGHLAAAAVVQDIGDHQALIGGAAVDAHAFVGAGHEAAVGGDHGAHLDVAGAGVVGGPVDQLGGGDHLGVFDFVQGGVEVAHQGFGGGGAFQGGEAGIGDAVDAAAGQFEVGEIIVCLWPRQERAQHLHEIAIGHMRGELAKAEGEGGAIITVQREEAAAFADRGRLDEIGPETVADGKIRRRLEQGRERAAAEDVVQPDIAAIRHPPANEEPLPIGTGEEIIGSAFDLEIDRHGSSPR